MHPRSRLENVKRQKSRRRRTSLVYSKLFRVISILRALHLSRTLGVICFDLLTSVKDIEYRY